MMRLALALIIVLATTAQAVANWQLYSKDENVIASFDYLSFAPYRNQPSVWVKWYNVSKSALYGGLKIQFTADCANHRLYEISLIPYDHNGKYLAETSSYNSPKEYPLDHNDLHQATYKLLCR